MNSKEKYFAWSDAWVFASLRGATNENSFNFVSFLATADMLNHAILRLDEVKQGFAKLYIRGLIEIEKENIKKTELAETLYIKVDKKRGGLFSLVDNCLSVLNSPRTKLPQLDVPPDLEFITPEYMSNKYKEYSEWAKPYIN
ncbi:MAG: hypothetical protein JNM55_10220 [Anaerolineales bacterium]|nr:hypothetical protein [Anaerolineales bacterium]